MLDKIKMNAAKENLEKPLNVYDLTSNSDGNWEQVT
jgi:hypothetical protein